MPRVEAHLDRRAALTGADFVIDTIQVGGARATQLDFEIPGRYGLEYTINDTINVGGVMRGLRSIPVILGIVRDMEELCPDAWFLNYTNPMSMIIWAVTSQSEVNTVGLCHSVYWTVHAIAGYIGAVRRDRHTSAGVNHLAFLLRLEHSGDDLYPRLDAAVREGRIPTTTSSGRSYTSDSATTRRSRRSTTPNTTRGSSRRARSSASTSRSASTSTASRGTSTSSTRPSGSWQPASRSRSSGAASTRQ